MPSPIITVENLSKKFIISHEAPERYKSLRDIMSNKVKGLTRKGNKQKSSFKEEFYALKDINFKVYSGDRLGIIGRNGAGKSTLLKILSRITEPNTGRITIRGRVASLLEVGTGFHPELTGRENIFLNGAILGMNRAEIRKKFDEIVDFAEVEKFLDTPVKRYSSGMYVRLAFAVAAHLEPEILIVDEVLSVGDAQFQKKCLGKMEDVSKNEGRTVLFVSHNMGVVTQLCKNAILLKKGNIIFEGAASEVITRYISNNTNESNFYKSTDPNNLKEIFFEEVLIVNSNNQAIEDFQFNESIYLKFRIRVNKNNPSALISFTLQNMVGEYLSTFVETLNRFTVKDNIAEFTIKLQPSIIAPNSYSFRFAIFNPSDVVFDLIEMVCPIRIIDNGTSMSIFEGVSYGNFFLDYEIC